MAPARKGAKPSGASPLAMMFTKEQHRSRTSSRCSVERQFLRWIGLSPDGPLPERRWNDLMHCSIRSTSIRGTKELLTGPNPLRSTGDSARGCLSTRRPVISAIWPSGGGLIRDIHA